MFVPFIGFFPIVTLRPRPTSGQVKSAATPQLADFRRRVDPPYIANSAETRADRLSLAGHHVPNHAAHPHRHLRQPATERPRPRLLVPWLPALGGLQPGRARHAWTWGACRAPVPAAVPEVREHWHLSSDRASAEVRQSPRMGADAAAIGSEMIVSACRGAFSFEFETLRR